MDELAALSKSNLAKFKDWRRRDGKITLIILHDQMANIRVFLRWCEEKEIVADGLADNVEMPDVEEGDMVSYVRLDTESAERIIAYHQQFRYTTRGFAMFGLMWEGLCRLGGVRSLDLEDYNREEGYITLTHSPEEGTPLKNGASNEDTEHGGGEREINLPEWVCQSLNEYLDGTSDPSHPQRIDVKDEYGRKPLFSTRNGRVFHSTIRRDLYRITQPCRYGQGCPYNRDPDKCDARNDNSRLSQCPSSVSPHPVRRGGICHQIKQGVNKDTICNRANVSRNVLDTHYDIRTREEARRQRRKELMKHLDGYEELKKPTAVETQIPLLQDALQVKRRVKRNLHDPVVQQRVIYGTAMFAIFVSLVSIYFAFLGIGIDLDNRRLVFEPL